LRPRLGPKAERLDGESAPPELPPTELEVLVAHALELRDEGRIDWLEEACRSNPGAAGPVRAAVRSADSLSGMIARAAERDAQRGQCLKGRFRLLERIGVGAMGAVYLAEDLELRRKVACKLVHHGLLPPQQALERFAREAEALAAVQHPAVVTIHDRGCTEAGQTYIVMELVDGPSIAALLDAARDHTAALEADECAWIDAALSVSTAGEPSYVRIVVRWIADLALGLEAVHRAGVLHRDIKPSNILLRRDGRPVLLDFGIALLDEQGGGTRTATSIGTPAYMPPETLRRDVQRTPASDVYSLAATLYHLLTLHAPYEGAPTQVLAQLGSRDPIPAAHLRPGLPRDLQAVLDRGMARNPARRYPSAAAFEADLRAFLEFRPVSARPVTLLERGLRRLARSRAALGALAVVALALIGLGFATWREHALDQRRARHAQIARHFPPNFTVVGAANREWLDPADRAALAALLDEAAEVAVEPLPTLLLRASFREDHGDPNGAASDMQRVAAFVGTPLARAIAARYRVSERAELELPPLVVEELPAAESPTDRYLLGYELLREQRYAEGAALLEDPQVRSIPHAEELNLALVQFVGLSGAEQRRLAVELYADLVRLEERLGERTAATSQIAARMLAQQDKYDDGARAAADGIALAPRAYTLRLNAGHCAHALGHVDEARAHYELARELRPNYAHIVQNLVWVEIAAERFDAALQLVADSAPRLVPASATWPDYWSALIAAYAALDAHADGDADLKARRLELARTHFDRVADLVRGSETAPADASYRIATALESGDDQALLLVLLELLAAEPHDWSRQRLLLRHMPPELDRRATSALRPVIEALDTRTPAATGD
jgi:tRNA A-37 threonylcarbamoyl transferase component Bud32